MASEPSALPILVVEDDFLTQNLLRAVLQRKGYVCDIAANGREAIVLLQGRAYAAILLDLMMPLVGGHTVIDFLNASGLQVPVVVCSAAGEAALAGFDPAVVKAIVRKPFDIDELVATIHAVTDCL